MRPWRQCGSLCPLSKVKIHIINHKIHIMNHKNDLSTKMDEKKMFRSKSF